MGHEDDSLLLQQRHRCPIHSTELHHQSSSSQQEQEHSTVSCILYCTRLLITWHETIELSGVDDKDRLEMWLFLYLAKWNELFAGKTITITITITSPCKNSQHELMSVPWKGRKKDGLEEAKKAVQKAAQTGYSASHQWQHQLQCCCFSKWSVVEEIWEMRYRCRRKISRGSRSWNSNCCHCRRCGCRSHWSFIGCCCCCCCCGWSWG